MKRFCKKNELLSFSVKWEAQLFFIWTTVPYTNLYLNT